MTTQPPEGQRGEEPAQPSGPQSPSGSQSPSARQQAPGEPEVAGGPQLGPGPAGPQAPGPPPEAAAPGYLGPTPPGGWQQPIPRAGGLPADAVLASWGSRVGAVLLDALVLTVLFLVMVAPGTALTIASDGGAAGIILIVVGLLAYLVVALLYAAFFVRRGGARNGQTLGKQWVGIRVVRTGGQPFDWGSALLRELVIKSLLFGVVGGAFASIPTLLDVLWPLWDDENRALHDMLASTHVVRS